MYNPSRHNRSIAVSASIRMLVLVFFLLLSLSFATTVAAQSSAEEGAESTETVKQATGDLEQVEARYVCMITNKVFDTEQIRIPLENDVYYGCCEMCVAKINENVDSRYATDPVTGNRVNKAKAVLGADDTRTVYYFESKETLAAFNAK